MPALPHTSICSGTSTGFKQSLRWTQNPCLYPVNVWELFYLLSGVRGGDHGHCRDAGKGIFICERSHSETDLSVIDYFPIQPNIDNHLVHGTFHSCLSSSWGWLWILNSWQGVTVSIPSWGLHGPIFTGSLESISQVPRSWSRKAQLFCACFSELQVWDPLICGYRTATLGVWMNSQEAWRRSVSNILPSSKGRKGWYPQW